MRSVRRGGPEMHSTLRAKAGDDADGMLLHMYRHSSISQRLKTVQDVI